jgi:hypothetical protein
LKGKKVQKNTVRPAAVAGTFYPSEADQLQHMLDQMFKNVAHDAPAPKAIIAPHAGYIYSGQIAADVYARLKSSIKTVTRVVLLGPAHRVGFHGIAASTAEYFSTPLGDIPLDRELLSKALDIEGVIPLNEAHAQEHSLEVQLPFLQTVLGEFTLAPFVVGEAPAELTASLLETLWGGDETLIVVSSDLSHFLDYRTACEKDATTATNIESYQGGKIGPHDACGYAPIRGLLKVAKQKNMEIKRVSICNSGDTAGDKSRVVGYASYALH